jgi:hypothetical protein
MGGQTHARADFVGPVVNGGGPDLFATAFINSVNSHLGSSECLAAAVASNPNQFEIKCGSVFKFFVDNCEVTGTLGGIGCAFNPTIVQVALPVPALSSSARFAVAAALLLFGAAYALRGRS